MKSEQKEKTMQNDNALRMAQENVILIGLPSSGKSTVGVLLAKHLGYRFLDSDLLIQEKEGMLLHELITERGADGFLAIENEVNAALSPTQTVISTGGSAVYGQEAMEHLRSIGCVIYLQIGFETMRERLGDYTHRGIVTRGGKDLRAMFVERVPLYEKYAHVTVPIGEDAILSDTVTRTLAAYENFLKN